VATPPAFQARHPAPRALHPLAPPLGGGAMSNAIAKPITPKTTRFGGASVVVRWI